MKAGDLMFSSRHLSTVFLYRPSEDKIIWLKTGPWLGQHDVDYLGEGRFAIFGNDEYLGRDFLGRQNSNIYFYDMNDGEITKPYEKVFRDNLLFTMAQGLQRILGNGDAFLELTGAGELYRISPDNIRWKFVHRISNSEIGALHWARYFNRNELDLEWLQGLDCSQ